MEVETYEAIERETGEQAPEMEAEAIDLIETLGLEGQRRLVSGENEEDQTRIPYRRMTEVEDRVYGALLKTKCHPNEYKAEVMPLRVLQVLAHAQDFFDKVKVWYTDDAAVEDPILVGYLERDSYGHDMFLLCRWGRTLLPFDDLREQAAEKLAREWRAKANKAKRTAEAFLGALEANVESHLHGESVREHMPTLGS